MKPIPSAALAAACLLALTGLGRAESFGASLAKGERAAREGELQAAVDYYSDALRVWDRRNGKAAKAKALAMRAQAYEREDETSASLRDWSQVLKLEPKKGAFWRKRGELYLRLRNPSRALSDFYKAAAIDLDDADAYFDRGVAYEMQGDLTFAHEDYRTACRLGFKKACKNAREAKERLLASRKGAAFEPVEEEKKGPVEIKRVKPKRRYKLDYPACIGSVKACVSGGDGFGQCVRAVKVCEERDVKGCCPKSCLKAFDELASERSEAEAFRDVFQPRAACAK